MRWWDGTGWTPDVLDHGSGGSDAQLPLGRPAWTTTRPGDAVDLPEGQLTGKAAPAGPKVQTFPPDDRDPAEASLPLSLSYSAGGVGWSAPFAVGLTCGAVGHGGAPLVALAVLGWVGVVYSLVLWVGRVPVLAADSQGVTLYRPLLFRQLSLPWTNVQAIQVVHHRGGYRSVPWQVLRVRTIDGRTFGVVNMVLPVSAEDAAAQLSQRWPRKWDSSTPDPE